MSDEIEQVSKKCLMFLPKMPISKGTSKRSISNQEVVLQQGISVNRTMSPQRLLWCLYLPDLMRITYLSTSLHMLDIAFRILVYMWLPIWIHAGITVASQYVSTSTHF